MMNTQKKHNKINILLSVLLLIVCGCWGFQTWKSLHSYNEYESKVDAITEIDPQERQESLNEVVEDGMINIQYSIGAVFEGTKSTSFNVKNSFNNHYPLIFSLYDPEGNIIYTSKMIEPGYEMNTIELEKELPKGTHACKIKIGYANNGNVASLFPITIEVR